MKHYIQIRRYRSIREKWRIGDGSGKDEGFLFFKSLDSTLAIRRKGWYLPAKSGSFSG